METVVGYPDKSHVTNANVIGAGSQDYALHSLHIAQVRRRKYARRRQPEDIVAAITVNHIVQKFRNGDRNRIISCAAAKHIGTATAKHHDFVRACQCRSIHLISARIADDGDG